MTCTCVRDLFIIFFFAFHFRRFFKTTAASTLHSSLMKWHLGGQNYLFEINAKSYYAILRINKIYSLNCTYKTILSIKYDYYFNKRVFFHVFTYLLYTYRYTYWYIIFTKPIVLSLNLNNKWKKIIFKISRNGSFLIFMLVIYLLCSKIGSN